MQEVKDFIMDYSWKGSMFKETISLEMAEYIVSDIKPCIDSMNDKAWWIESSLGRFLVRTAYQVLRHKNVQVLEWAKKIWVKGIFYKISFFL